jgi:integrase
MRREVKPAAAKLGIGLTGWHDFRHFFARALRKSGAHPKVVSGLMGHSKVNLALDVYDHFDEEEGRGPIGQLLHNVTRGKEAA